MKVKIYLDSLPVIIDYAEPEWTMKKCRPGIVCVIDMYR